METIELIGQCFQVDDKTLTVMEELSIKTSCKGNACGDIDYQWDEDTNSYHFFNDGNKRLTLKVNSATYFGCTAFWKERNMRPGDEWDSKFNGICRYEANYR